MIPRSINFAFAPVIVYVLPLPVGPYAKIVPLYPFKHESITSLATLSNIYSCFTLPLKTYEN